MLRVLFAGILLLHGLIHLMGFAKAFKYAELPQLQMPVSRPAGVGWLLTSILFIITAALFLWKKETWWMAALPAVVISQILIFSNWQDAKFGSIANILVLLGAVLAWGSWDFSQMLEKEKQAFLAAFDEQPRPALDQKQIAELPLVVQNWLTRSNSLGKPVPQQVQLRQTGQMRTNPKGKWMPFSAQQYIRVADPGFFWTVDVKAAPFLQLKGRDKYENGKGYMLIKAQSLFPVVDVHGPKTAQGALLRYLAEIIWHPASALAEYIHWEHVPGDTLAAQATMRFGGVEASGVFRFSPEGDPVSFDAMRYYDRKEGATLEKWLIRIDPDGFREFEDVRIPARSIVSWELESGTFEWLELVVTDLSFAGKLQSGLP